VDLESIKSIWESWKEVQEKKLDPVGQADGDIDNDGDEDESDKYLANRRKKIGKEISKDNVKEEDDSEEDDSEEDSEDDKKKSKKPKKGVNPFAKKKDEDEDEDDINEFNESISDLMEANLPINMLVGPGGVGGGKTYKQAAKEMMKDAWRALTGKQKKVIAKVHKLTQTDDELGKLYRDGWKGGGTSMKPGVRKAFDARVKELIPNEETRDYVAAWKDVKAKVQSSMKDQNESAEMPEWLEVIGEKLKAMEESDDPVADEEEAYKDDKKPSKGIKKDAKKNDDEDDEESDNGEPTTEKMKGMRKEDFASEANWRVSSMREALAVMEANKQTQGATKSEPYDDTASQGSKDFIKMHKQSNPDLEDLEDNKAVLPTGVKSQAPSRRGDNLNNGDGKKPKK